MKLIQTITVGAGGAANIEFTSIPQTYTDLILKLSIRSSFSAIANNISISFNGSTSNFSQRMLSGNGSSVSSFNRTDNLNALTPPGASATVNTFGNGEIYIPNYTSNTNKSFSIDEVGENNGTEAYAQIHAFLWSNTAAITSIAVTPQNSATFSQYASASLYGILKGSGGATVS